MKTENFKRELPDGYKRVFGIDAKNGKVGLIMNLAAFGIMVLVAALMIGLPLLAGHKFELGESPFLFLLFLPIYIVYIVLHELTHGAAYKLATGEKLTFGLTLTVAFCGVPNIYVYRRAAILAAAAPLVLFSAVFGALAAVFWFVSSPLYLLLSIIFATHVGGCVGDIYLVSLLTFKYRDNKTLVRDTGPEQNIFILEKSEETL